MNETVALVATGGVLVAAGTVLLLDRPLTRIILGTIVLGNGVNVLLLSTSGAASRAPLLYKVFGPQRFTDPLPQAFVLTAIVITLALTAFLSAMAYRAWQLSGTDDVQDDVEDLRVAQRAEYGEGHPEEGTRRLPKERERRARRRELLTAGEEEEQAEEEGALRHLRRSGAEYREARRRARADVRAHHALGARREEEAAENDMWEMILGADR